MAQENYTVFFALKDSVMSPAEFKEGAVVVAGKNKSKGLATGTGWLTNEPSTANFVTLVAESAEEAAKAIRSFYGQGIANDKFLVAKTSNLSEVVAIP